MFNFVNELQSVKVKTFLLAVSLSWLVGWIFMYAFVDSYQFDKISKRSVEVQKKCLDQFLDVFQLHKIALILFDIDILPELFQSRPKSWHRSSHKCKTLCKFHPDEKNVITFAVKGANFEGREELVVDDLEKLGFAVHLSIDKDPRLAMTDQVDTLIPTYLWLAKNDHVIHVAFLRERPGNFYWIGPVRDKEWRKTVNALAPALSGNWRSMEKIGAKFPTYAQAFDFSERFLGLPLDIDGHKVNVPYFITKFLDEYRQSRFEECNYDRARIYKKMYETSLKDEEKKFKVKAKQLISHAKSVLDRINIPFWLCSSTCLGWFRQCDIIPYSSSISFGVSIHDFSLKIIEEMHDNNLNLLHKLGKADDSLELSFIGKENIKLNLIFYYNETSHYWTGGTQISDGQKFRYKFSKFELCWTEFLQIKIRVPCEAHRYITEHYGKNWMVPVKGWQWNLHPPNLEPNGYWHESDKEVAIQSFSSPGKDEKKMHVIRKGAQKQVNIPEELDAHISMLKDSKENEDKEPLDKVRNNQP